MTQALLKYARGVYSRLHLSPESSPLMAAQTFGIDVNDGAASQKFILSDGRKIGFANFGARCGPTVFYWHGFPGCRLSGRSFDKPGKKLGARIIAVERPGVGISSPQTDHKMLDRPNDMDELAEHLYVDSYDIIGVSGRSPRTPTCAHFLLKKNVHSVAIFCGMGPFALSTNGMSWGNCLILKGLLYSHLWSVGFRTDGLWRATGFSACKIPVHLY
ncbi:hypothetical protein FZEAL_2066 [Fusarium zealandicum]|uniref:AB hydrolase-1 domain-containing protein n=1 Tax=Fusarium zealandicum TaxID=1053134 RepID=A0A8H4URT0_9HYPO|nr:hypothetical protein FZEAL_2066 [Fusarium zealandicum]